MLEKSFLAENGANLRKVSFGMFSVYYSCSRYDIMCTIHKMYIGSSTRVPYIFSSITIANGTKECSLFLLECWHGPNNLRRELKLA